MNSSAGFITSQFQRTGKVFISKFLNITSKSFKGPSYMRSTLIALIIVFFPLSAFSQEANFKCQMEIFIDIDKHGITEQELEEFSFSRSSGKIEPKIVFDGKSMWFGSSEFYTVGNFENFNTVRSGSTKIFMNGDYFNYSHTSAIATQAIVAKCIKSIP